MRMRQLRDDVQQRDRRARRGEHVDIERGNDIELVLDRHG